MSSGVECHTNRARLLGLVAIVFLSALAGSQSENKSTVSPAPGFSTFKSKVQVVLVDVVVTDRENRPITGLQAEDFELSENHKRQKVASFEEHRGDLLPPPLDRPKLPPHFYSNLPENQPPGALNILLLDALNTDFSGQATVRLEMIKYLQTINPGPSLAIFTLGSQLRMVEGFTQDPKLLIAALKHKNWGGTPQNSALLRSSAESETEAKALSEMSVTKDGQNIGASQEAIADFENFLREVNTTESVSRMLGTLDALQMLSRYLNGFPGRKNLIWFSGSFPKSLFFTPSHGRGPGQLEIDDRMESARRKTIHLLGAAQVAVYTVVAPQETGGAKGVEPPSIYQAATAHPPVGSGKTPEEQLLNGLNESLNTESVNRNIDYAAADVIASETGGSVFYNTNGLRDAMAEIVRNGSYYYRLSYYPSDKKMIGRYRHIEVKIKHGAHPDPRHVSYRRGYYEADESHHSTTAAESNPLHALMRRGLPNATQLIFSLMLVPSNSQPATGAPLIGDSNDLRAPVTRYSADFIVPLDALELDTDSQGVRHGNVELALVASGHDGKPLNWIIRQLHLTLKPDIYTSVQKTGIKLHENIDVPKGYESAYLRSGIYDLASGKAGTLEIPFSAVSQIETGPSAIPTTSLKESSSPISPASPAPPSSTSIPASSATTNVSMASGDASAALAISAMDELRQLAPADVPKYCAELAGSDPHASSLAAVCQSVFDLRKTLTNIICDREARRYWSEKIFLGRSYGYRPHSETLAVNVTYRDGQEHYSDPRINGAPVAASDAELSPDWSHGEFVTLLAGIFAPSSRAQFHYSKQTRVRSTPAFVFDFLVAAQNNRVYFLQSKQKIGFPAYHGSIWVDARTSSLLRLQLETAYLRGNPLQTKHEIEYANIFLGDGTSMVLPTNSTVFLCNDRDCARSLIAFKNWHKFRATTNIVVAPNN